MLLKVKWSNTTHGIERRFIFIALTASITRDFNRASADSFQGLDGGFGV